MARKFVTVINLSALFLFCVLVLPAPGLAETISRTTLDVQNLSCSSCLADIKASLSRQEGMKGMTADLWQKQVVVDHSDPLSSAQIASLITELGYPATVLAEEDVEVSDQEKDSRKRWYSQGIGCNGCSPKGCAASASSWQKFYRRYFGKKK